MNTAIKQTSMASAPTNYRRRRSHHQNSAAAHPRILGCAAQTAQRSRPIFIAGHTITTIYYESIWLDPFTNIAFAISTSENRPTFNLSYWMTCTRFRMNSRNRSVSQNSQRSSASGSSIILDKYRPSVFQRDMTFQGVRQRGNAWIIK